MGKTVIHPSGIGTFVTRVIFGLQNTSIDCVRRCKYKEYWENEQGRKRSSRKWAKNEGKMDVKRCLNRSSPLVIFIQYTLWQQLIPFSWFRQTGMLLSTFGSKSFICCLAASKFRNICSSSFIRIIFRDTPVCVPAVGTLLLQLCKVRVTGWLHQNPGESPSSKLRSFWAPWLLQVLIIT
jgi:hypothetical protein